MIVARNNVNALIRRCGTSSCKSKQTRVRYAAPLSLLTTPSTIRLSDSTCTRYARLIVQRAIHHHSSTPLSKVCSDAKTALGLSGLKDGDTVAVGTVIRECHACYRIQCSYHLSFHMCDNYRWFWHWRNTR